MQPTDSNINHKTQSSPYSHTGSKDLAFIITVDTEGDNLWQYKPGDAITTRNTAFIPRFQQLCDRFGFKPVYLTNYEMALDDSFVESAKEWLSQDRCEIGVHLHAWNNPPLHPLTGPHSGQSYLIEYPEEVMRQKFDTIYSLLQERFGITPTSHRAGRWAMNDTYFKILEEFGITVDCSHTPGISWSRSYGITCGGSDYSNISPHVGLINGVLEVPMTVRHTHCHPTGSLKHRLKSLIGGTTVWLRPATESSESMIWLADKVHKEADCNYLEFMIHSSELMPGGSPYVTDNKALEEFYAKMEALFTHVHNLGYRGQTLNDYQKTAIKSLHER